jgi:carbon-monoxide dehydrogenase medium subunit
VFLKVMRRQAMDCSIVAVAARVSLTEDGATCAEARIAVGAAAPTPFRARGAEALLAGQIFSEELLQEAALRTVQAAHPIADVRATAEYRRRLVHGLVCRAVSQAWRRAESQPCEVTL